MKNLNDENDMKAYEPAEWLAAALSTYRLSTDNQSIEAEDSPEDNDFIQRCHGAASIALSLAKLSRERHEIGFIPLSFADYVDGLLKLVDVPLSPILSWLKIDNLSKISAGTASAFARLAQALGMPLQEALLHIRIGFAARIGSAPITLLGARHRRADPQHSPVTSCNLALEQIESEYDLEVVRELRRIEANFDAVYKA